MAMWQTWRDRLRIPWRGGAKQLSREAVLPAVLLPLIFGIAALNQYLAGVITFFVAVILLFAHYRAQQQLLRTRFFFMWLLWSLIYIVILFESTVPLLEVLPEENLILVILSLISVWLLYRTRSRASLNQVPSKIAETTGECLPNIEEEEDEAPLTANYNEDAEAQKGDESVQNTCHTCHKYMPPRTAHCYVCGVCVLRHDHHSYWLDCCIGKANHCSYFMGMMFSASALLLAANLILTAVCHPLLVKRLFGVPLMLPDDCSQVFNEYEFSLSFMLAVYAIGIAVYIKAAIVQQVYLVSIGLTLNERRHGQERNHRSIWTNWKNLLLG